MPYLHSLVRSEMTDAKGWFAPVEVGEAAPHYVSFVVPVDRDSNFFEAYTCESVTAGKKSKRIERHRLELAGSEAFLLNIHGMRIWFVVKPVSKDVRRLPYIGRLEHPDFDLKFAEIEPENSAILDELFDEHRVFVMGCDPFTNYSGLKAELTVSQSRS